MKKILLGFILTSFFSVSINAKKIDVTKSLPTNSIEIKNKEQAKKEANKILKDNLKFSVESESIDNSAKNARAVTKYKTYVRKRGISPVSTSDYIYFGYNGSTVLNSSGYQTAISIFPSIARNDGIYRFHKGTGFEKWRAKNTMKIGVPTPWGDVAVSSFSLIHEYQINKTGSVSKLK